MTKIHFNITILGGPNDGIKGVYNGTSEMLEDGVIDKMAAVQVGDHIYKIIEYDKQNKHVVLKW